MNVLCLSWSWWPLVRVHLLRPQGYHSTRRDPTVSTVLWQLGFVYFKNFKVNLLVSSQSHAMESLFYPGILFMKLQWFGLHLINFHLLPKMHSFCNLLLSARSAWWLVCLCLWPFVPLLHTTLYLEAWPSVARLQIWRKSFSLSPLNLSHTYGITSQNNIK